MGVALNTAMFVEKARSIHGDLYVYDKTLYSGARNKLMIECKTHGIFTQTPTNHLSGQGCPKCGITKAIQASKDKIKRKVDDIICTANSVHESKYEYVISEGPMTSLSEVKCSVHGWFKQSMYHHIHLKQGCPKCTSYGFNVNREGVVYTLLSDCEKFIKIGITGDTDRRFKELRDGTPFMWSVLSVEKMSGEDAKRTEKERHALMIGAGMTGFDGCSEWFINPCK